MPADIIIVNVAYLLTFIALAVREIYWLRIILTIAQFGQLAHAYLNLDYSKGFWTLIFVIINLIQIIQIRLTQID